MNGLVVTWQEKSHAFTFFHVSEEDTSGHIETSPLASFLSDLYS